MALVVKPETAAALQSLAAAKGLSVEAYLELLVERELPAEPDDTREQASSGMVWENGLFVYRTGQPLPPATIDDAIRQIREESTRRILGNHS